MRVSGCGWFRGAARRGAPSRSVPWTVPVSALRHQAERRAGKGTPTSGQFSRWGPAQPAAGGRQGRNWATPAGWRCVVSRPSRAAMPVGDPHRENWPALQALSALVSRSRAMPVGDRRSNAGQRPALQAALSRAGFALPRDAGRRPTGRSETGAPSVVGAGFALPRDAGRRPALQALSALVSRSRAMPVGDRRSKRCRRWFRAPARCRSETGAPSVVGAGFALPRDAGRRPALQALSALVSRSRAMPVGDRPPPGELAGAPSVVGAGFALPRDAGRRPALQALSALVSRSRAMPVGDRRSVSW